MSRPDPLPVTGVSEVALSCSDREELRACTEFYCETLGFPLVTAWQEREDANYGEPLDDVAELDVDDVKGDHEVWVKAGSTLVGLWLRRELPAEADRPPSEWGDVWDQGGEHVHFALEATPGDFEAVTDALRARGIDYKLVTHAEYNDARSVFVRDPAGHALEIAERDLRITAEQFVPE